MAISIVTEADNTRRFPSTCLQIRYNYQTCRNIINAVGFGFDQQNSVGGQLGSDFRIVRQDEPRLPELGKLGKAVVRHRISL